MDFGGKCEALGTIERLNDLVFDLKEGLDEVFFCLKGRAWRGKLCLR